MNSLRLLDLIDRQNVGMIERGNCSRLRFKPSQSLWAPSEGGRQHLQCDFALEACIFRQVNAGHATPPQFAEYDVAPEALPNGRYIRIDLLLGRSLR